jgi:hypothetical protein
VGEDHDFYEDDTCWNCGGEGFVASCVSEYACLYPEDGLIDWQRCVDRIQNIARAALESTSK